jgi:hypothetical protein
MTYFSSTVKREWTNALIDATNRAPKTEDITGDTLFDLAICHNQDLTDVFDLDPFDEGEIREYADRLATQHNLERKESE